MKVVLTIASALVFMSVGCLSAELQPDTVERKEKDYTGREWNLKEWKEKEVRPYPKLLIEREAWYRKKWGEGWRGAQVDCRILSPGDWKWEEVFRLPSELGDLVSSKGKKTHGNMLRVWGKIFFGMCFVWAPGGADVTDVYALSDECIINYDTVTKKITVIGQPRHEGSADGVNGKALVQPGKMVTLDPVSGRLYFIQGKNLRYIEKLLPFESVPAGNIYYLPALLAWHQLYRQVTAPDGGALRPSPKESLQQPLFVVRTNSALKRLSLPGASYNRVGRRPLISPDGKSAWFANHPADEQDSAFDDLSLFDIESGSQLERLKVKGSVPKNFRSGSDGPGSHGGSCVGAEGLIFNSQHGGCCGPCGAGKGRMFSINPIDGSLTLLYDSMNPDGSWKKEGRHLPSIDGPADATSLYFTSTLWQSQCPRTGAILSGGWDFSGIRRYHDGFVTSVVNVNEEHRKPPRPNWVIDTNFYHGNSSPSVAPDGSLYIADDNAKVARVIRLYRTDWPKEQPVNGYVEQFTPKEKLRGQMLEYARNYLANFARNNELIRVNQDDAK